jgi:DNA-binding transcriptional ArsR family regulator
LSGLAPAAPAPDDGGPADQGRSKTSRGSETHMPQVASLELDAMRDSADSACTLMKVLANPDRLLLLCQLAQGEKNVGELQDLLGILQPTLSQQLAVLREEQLVATRREGKNIYYRIDSPQALAVIDVLYAQFCKPAKRRPSRR